MRRKTTAYLQRAYRGADHKNPSDDARGAWNQRVWTEFDAGNLTRCYRDVLLVMGLYLGRADIFPSHATIAFQANCSVGTVQAALNMGRTLGLLHWWSGDKRRVGNRFVNSPNHYQLFVPEHAVFPGQRPPFPRRVSANKVGGGEVSKIPEKARQGPDLLQMRCDAFMTEFRQAAGRRWGLSAPCAGP